MSEKELQVPRHARSQSLHARVRMYVCCRFASAAGFVTVSAVYELYHFGSASIRWSPDARHTRGWSFWSFCRRNRWDLVWVQCCRAEQVSWPVGRLKKGKTGSSCYHTARNIEESMGLAPAPGWIFGWRTSQALTRKKVYSPSQHSSWLIYCRLNFFSFHHFHTTLHSRSNSLFSLFFELLANPSCFLTLSTSR